jgi:hypothetical protein
MSATVEGVVNVGERGEKPGYDVGLGVLLTLLLLLEEQFHHHETPRTGADGHVLSILILRKLFLDTGLSAFDQASRDMAIMGLFYLCHPGVHLTLTKQKNCNAGEKIAHRRTSDPMLCPTTSLARLVHNLCWRNAPPSTPLHSMDPPTQLSVHACHITAAL